MLGHVLPMVMGILGSGALPSPPASNPLSSTMLNVITVEGPSVNVGISGLHMQPGNNPYSRLWHSTYASPTYYPYGQPYGGYSPALSRWTRMVHNLLDWKKTLSPGEFAQLEQALNVSSESTVLDFFLHTE